MYCTKCGAFNKENQAFCTNCGASLITDDYIPSQDRQDEPNDRTGSNTPPKKKSIVLPIVVCLLVSLVVGGTIGAFFAFGSNPILVIKNWLDTDTSSTEPDSAAEPEPEQNPDPDLGTESGQDADAIGIKETVNDYTWDELSKIAQSIADATSDEEAKKIAIKYHLCDSKGKLDGSQQKTVSFTDGISINAQIVGFRHDERTDTKSHAGITFLMCDSVCQLQANSNGKNLGGWQGSDVRRRLERDIYQMLPSDLRDSIVAVNKLSNNRGLVYKDGKDISTTSDKLWLLSQVEISGTVQGREFPEGFEWVASYYNGEGSQYQLFKDCEVDWNGVNKALVKRYGGEACLWWLRTADQDVDDTFRAVTAQGLVHNSEPAERWHGVVPGFCL